MSRHEQEKPTYSEDRSFPIVRITALALLVATVAYCTTRQTPQPPSTTQEAAAITLTLEDLARLQHEQVFRQSAQATPAPFEPPPSIETLLGGLDSYMQTLLASQLSTQISGDFKYGVGYIGPGIGTVLPGPENDSQKTYTFPMIAEEFESQPIAAGTRIGLQFMVDTDLGSFHAVPHPKGDGWRFIPERAIQRLAPPPGMI